jgi:polysaccharide deacetylase family protein (PEP-CTERM system associated)
MPELVREVVDRGHEVASKGYFHRSICRFSSPAEFREDLARSREALERASGTPVWGFRIGHRWFSPEDLWALDILAEEGFKYDSSVRPIFRRYAREPWRGLPHLHKHGDREIWEFPLAATGLFGWKLPISGGNYFRQFSPFLMKRAVSKWMASHDAPFLMYFHVWELDPDQPRIRAAPLRERIRQYRNLDKMADIVRHYLKRYEFGGIADYLGLSRERVGVARTVVGRDEDSAVHIDPERLPITVVVPCFNEELILPYLANTLSSVERTLQNRYDLRFLFVDDGSTDATWPALHEVFGDLENCTLVRHGKNRGVAAAIMTGIDASETEIVCSIDCDCTYDPHQLETLIPMLTDDADMVTASPYHVDGVVKNVPEWRLFLSKSLSRLYRVVLSHQLATYTSCFRVYRRGAIQRITISEGGFLGVAEMLGLLDLGGGVIVECPAVLEVRLLGRSKMKTLNTILGHLRLLIRLGVRRLRGASRETSQTATSGFEEEPTASRSTAARGALDDDLGQ